MHSEFSVPLSFLVFHGWYTLFSIEYGLLVQELESYCNPLLHININLIFCMSNCTVLNSLYRFSVYLNMDQLKQLCLLWTCYKTICTAWTLRFDVLRSTICTTRRQGFFSGLFSKPKSGRYCIEAIEIPVSVIMTYTISELFIGSYIQGCSSCSSYWKYKFYQGNINWFICD